MRRATQALRISGSLDDAPPRNSQYWRSTKEPTTSDDRPVVLDAIRAGARGFLLKDISYEQLMRAIRAMAAGGTVFQPAITQRLLRAAGTPAPDAMPIEELTARELEVVRLMA